MFKEYKEQIEIANSERRVRTKELQEELKQEVQRLKGEWAGIDQKFEQKEQQNKKWIGDMLKDNVGELSKMVDKKLVENEVTIRKLLLKGGFGSDGEGIKSNELKALKEKNMLEYIDTMINNLKLQLQSELEEDKALKNNRFDEITRLIHTHKSLLDEHIQQQGESLKALLKANLNEESV